jgi:hypothetical protein
MKSEYTSTLTSARPSYAQGIRTYGAYGMSEMIQAPTPLFSPVPSPYFKDMRPFHNPLTDIRCVPQDNCGGYLNSGTKCNQKSC